MGRVQGWADRKDRHGAVVDAVVHRTDGSTSPARLTNFSDQGCRIEADAEFRIGERLQIAIPRMGHMKAQVRWTMAGSAGAKFLVESDF
ncbi:MAG: PilZ domain-containing protein [Sphingomonas sp.]|nr:PilZ domain-containing protein [Sphingomonas sp.]